MKDNHDGERIRLKEQTFLRGLISVHCVLERNLQTYTRLKSDIFNSTATVMQHMHCVSIIFFCTETFASVKKLYTRNLKQQNEKKRKITNQAILKLFFWVTDLLNGVNV